MYFQLLNLLFYIVKVLVHSKGLKALQINGYFNERFSCSIRHTQSLETPSMCFYFDLKCYLDFNALMTFSLGRLSSGGAVLGWLWSAELYDAGEQRIP